jgi:molybdate transport system substrate-binding protein
MTKRGDIRINLVLATAAILVWPTASFAQVKVITSGGFSAALRELAPEFEKATGITVTTTIGKSQGSGPDTISRQLSRGVPADVVVMSREGLNGLIADGRIADGTDLDLAQVPLGLSVRAGAPKPDISSVEAFKQTLLRAKSITFPDSTTGLYMMEKLFPQLGIANELAPKITHTGVVALGEGNAEIAIQPVSELLHVPGADYVGPIPTEVQYISVFSAALVAGSEETDAAKRLIAFLTSESATTAIRNSGMAPPGSRRGSPSVVTRP